MSSLNFKSDNVVGIHPHILEAISKANAGTQSSYGADDYSLALKTKLSAIFETPVEFYLTSTGTAANSLALSAITKPYESIYCHHAAHINTDECHAPELFTGGTKIITFPGDNGKIDLDALINDYKLAINNKPHMSKPGCITLTQATEYGTVYTPDELLAIADFAKSHKLPIHMDGARFTNAIGALDCSPADLTWKSGIDIMSLGATKNGALAAEAVIIFNQDYAKNFDYIHKRGGQLISKTRFFASQFLAYFENDLWLKNGNHANQMASQLLAVFNAHQITVKFPVQSNEVFVVLPKELAQFLENNGVEFYSWGPSNENLYRFVTSWDTRDTDISQFGKVLNEY